MIRRNRSDKQSRDFVCPCGKAYLSYAALYTHIKKFHQSSKDIFNQIKVPKRQHLQRGRPSHKRKLEITSKYEELNQFQLSILNIYNQLLGKVDPILLEGNQELVEIQVQRAFDPYRLILLERFQQSISSQEVKVEQASLTSFFTMLLKHFVGDVQVKIKFIILVLILEQKINGCQEQECISIASNYQLFPDSVQVVSIINQIFRKWKYRQSTQNQEQQYFSQ